MKRKNRILALLLCLVMVLSAAPVTALAETAESGSCGDSATWTLTTDGVLTISGTGAMTDYGYYGSGSEAPWNDNYGDHGVKKVVVESGITHVGAAAFSSCGSLTSVTLPDSVATIGDGAFSHCAALPSITLPANLTAIGEELFAYCAKLTGVTIPGTVTSIGKNAFRDSGVTSLTIPSSVKSVGQEAFSGSQITSLTLPNTVTSVGAGLFRGCEKLTYAKLPSGITRIGESMFQGCTALNTYTIPSSVKEISRYAFANSGLTAATLPKALTTMGTGAFVGCTGLTAFQVTSGNTAFAAEDGVLFNIDKTELICFPAGKTGEYTIPGTVTALPDSVFESCAGLTKVTIPGSVKTVGSWVFMYCTGLKSVVIQSGVAELGKSMFLGCRAMTSISIPASVTKIGPWAFEETGFTSFTFPDTVKELGNSIFYECSALKSVTLPAGITRIPNWIFEGCSSLTSFTIPDTVTELGDGVFVRSGLTAITIPAKVTAIGSSAFAETKLTSITIPDTVTTLGEQMLYGCSSLKNVKLPAGLKEIPDGMMARTGLTSYMVPEGITKIGGYAFENCGNLTYISLPQTLQELGSGVFQYDAALTHVTIPEGVAEIPDHTFEGCAALKSVTVPASVTSLGMQAFWNCEALKDVYFTGTQTQFEAITGVNNNYWFKNATVHYVKALTAPTITQSGVNAGGKPYLKWNAVEGASKYAVYRATSQNGTYSKYYTTSNTSYTNTSAEAGKTYYYKICAVDGNGLEGPFSTVVTVKATAGLTAPAITQSGVNVDGKPRIEWNAVEGASKYAVYRATSEDGTFSKYYTTTYTSFTNTSAEAGKTYWYKVCALGVNGSEGPFSTVVSIKAAASLNAPAIRSSGVNASGKPTLTWDSVPNASKYVVYRATSASGTFSKYYTTTNTSFTNTSAEAGKTYWYKVCALDANGIEGPFSAVVSVKATSTQVAAPAFSAKWTTASGKPYLKWGAVEGASKYVVYRATSEGGTFSKYYTTTNTSFTNTSAEAGKTYWYKVCAVDSSGAEGAFSEVAKITATAAMTAPHLQGGNDANGKPMLTFGGVGASKYAIYRATSEGGTFSKYYTTSGFTFTNTSAEAGKTYWYKVCGIGADGSQGPFSNVVSVTATAALTAPVITASGVTAGGKPYLEWNAVEGAAEYVIYRDYNYYYATTNTSFTNSSAEAGKTYVYGVSAVSNMGYSGPYTQVSITATAALTAPVITSHTTNSSGKPYLKWNAVEGASKYTIYRATSQNGTYSRMYTTVYTSYTNTSAEADKTYYYKVCAVGANGSEGPRCGAVSVTAK